MFGRSVSNLKEVESAIIDSGFKSGKVAIAKNYLGIGSVTRKVSFRSREFKSVVDSLFHLEGLNCVNVQNKDGEVSINFNYVGGQNNGK